MDIDTMNRNITRLLKFMDRVEKQKVVSDPAASGGFGEAKHKELEERILAVSERLDKADVVNMRDQLNALDEYKVQVVEPALKDIESMLPQLKEMGEVVTWFRENKAMLEGAIAMADAFDGPNAPEGGSTDGLGGGTPGTTETPVADVTTGAGTADPGPQTGTGAVSGDPLPDAGLGTDASQAAADDAKLATDRPGGV